MGRKWARCLVRNPEEMNTTKCSANCVHFFVLTKENFCLCPGYLQAALNADELEKIMHGINWELEDSAISATIGDSPYLQHQVIIILRILNSFGQFSVSISFYKRGVPGDPGNIRACYSIKIVITCQVTRWIVAEELFFYSSLYMPSSPE